MSNLLITAGAVIALWSPLFNNFWNGSTIAGICLMLFGVFRIVRKGEQ